MKGPTPDQRSGGSLRLAIQQLSRRANGKEDRKHGTENVFRNLIDEDVIAKDRERYNTHHTLLHTASATLNRPAVTILVCIIIQLIEHVNATQWFNSLEPPHLRI